MQDSNDPLAHYRSQFHLPDGVIYLDGNSLGAMVKTAPERIEQAVKQEWATDLITSWNKAGWWQLPQKLGAKIAPLVGAQDDCVIVTDSTSINIYKALHAALALRPDRSVIVAEETSFPTDLYMAQGTMQSRPGLNRRLIGEGGKGLVQALDNDVAVVLLSHVDYRSGALLDMASITRQVHESGALMIWDLCHSVGAIEVELDKSDVDFAIGCTYKYLNGGPGSPAFIYANKKHHGKIQQPLSGWWGHAEPFAFDQDFQPAQGMRAMLCGTQPIISMVGLDAALDVFKDIKMAEVRQKSKKMTQLFSELVLENCSQYEIKLFGPDDADARGSQVSFSHPNAYAVMQALISQGVIGDFRQPNIIRFGFSTLYLSFQDVRNAAQLLSNILETGDWKQYQQARSGAVT